MDVNEKRAHRAAQFYAMMVLLKCSHVYYEDLHSVGGIVIPVVRDHLSDMYRKYKKVINAFIGLMNKDLKKKWDEDFSRDILTIASVVEKMAAMNDLQRSQMEMFAAGLLDGTVKLGPGHDQKD